jgi:hypothetical protein
VGATGGKHRTETMLRQLLRRCLRQISDIAAPTSSALRCKFACRCRWLRVPSLMVRKRGDEVDEDARQQLVRLLFR